MVRVTSLILMVSLFAVACGRSGNESSEGVPIEDTFNPINSEQPTEGGAEEPTNGTTLGGSASDGNSNSGDTTSGGTTSGGSTSGGSTSGGSISGGSTSGGSTSGGSTSGGTILPSGATNFKTNIKLVGFSGSRLAKMREAISIVKLVIGTQEFRTKLLNHTYGGRKTFVDNRGHSNTTIYNNILNGAETLQPSKNNTMDMEVELYYDNTNTVGYTYPNTRRIYVNSKYFDSYNAASVANNLMHEWLHKLGYGHAQTWSTSRDYSVPYAVGKIMGQVAVKFL